MKQLLLITAISCVCASSLFAGSSCCPTAPAQNAKEKAADADDVTKDAEKDTMKDLLAANESTPSMAPADDTNAAPTMPATPDSNPSDTQLQTKFLLAGGSAPSATDADKPAAPADEKTTETEADNAAQPQLIA